VKRDRGIRPGFAGVTPKTLFLELLGGSNMVKQFIKNKIIELCNSFYVAWSNGKDNPGERYAIIIVIATLPLSLLFLRCIPTSFWLGIPLPLKLLACVVAAFSVLTFGLFFVFDSTVPPLHCWVKREIQLLKNGYEAKPKWKTTKTKET
jgi:hypothetical protein